MAVNILKLSEISEYLGSQSQGTNLRQHITDIWAESHQIICDFSDVLGMTGIFADEAFGKIFIEKGSDDYIDKVRFRNLNDVVHAVLKGALYRRYKEIKGEDDWGWMN